MRYYVVFFHWNFPIFQKNPVFQNMDRSTKRKIKNQQKKKKANLLDSSKPVAKPEKKPEDFEDREIESEADIKSDEPLNKKAKIGQNDESDSGNEEIGGNPEEADIEIGQNGTSNEPVEEFTKDTKVFIFTDYIHTDVYGVGLG